MPYATAATMRTSCQETRYDFADHRRSRIASVERAMSEIQKITTEPGLTFDVMIDGAADAPLVLLLHGFCESFHMWRELVPALAAAGYRAVAPSQRGYSPGARPDT